MSVRNKTCLFCLKQRQILVDDSSTAAAIQKIFSITLPSDECRICIECHFNIGRIREFKHSIERAADFDVDSCFVCKSEKTVNEPGVDLVVDYLLKQCTTFDIGSQDTVRACVSCLYLLEICIKYEKLARNYANAQRFCKQFSTMQECNVALWKVDLDLLGDICEGYDCGRPKRGRKQSKGDDRASKRSKKEDGSVLPVMLTKLTPTMQGGKKKLGPNFGPSKGKPGPKPNSKIFFKLPASKKTHWKKRRLTYGPPASPSLPIPTSPSVEDLNRIFGIELRSLSVRIERVDLSNFMNRTIAHDATTRHPRKPRKEEFIGLDEEDVVELQQNTSVCSVSGKRKSILVTERIESPNSAKKKVKFSDSPSIKYVDKLEFSDDDDDDSENDDDADYEEKKPKKRAPKPQNGATPENGKPRRGRPKKNSSDEPNDGGTTGEGKKDGQQSESDRVENVASEDAIKELASEEQKDGDGLQKIEDPSSVTSDEQHEPKSRHEEQNVVDTALENGDVPNIKQSHDRLDTPIDARADEQPCTEQSTDADLFTRDESATPMEAKDETGQSNAESAESTAQNDAPDTEMKDASTGDSPEDIEMAETKSPVPDDIEMKEEKENVSDLLKTTTQACDSGSVESQDKSETPQEHIQADFEVSDKEEDDEIEQVKKSLDSFLGEQVSDSEPSQEYEPSKPMPIETHEQEVQPKLEPEAQQALQEAETQTTTLEQQPQLDDAKAASSEYDSNAVQPSESPEKKNQSYSSLDDVDDISDDDGILDQLDDVDGDTRRRSPDLPPLGEDSL